jgi:hypothetical protein
MGDLASDEDGIRIACFEETRDEVSSFREFHSKVVIVDCDEAETVTGIKSELVEKSKVVIPVLSFITSEYSFDLTDLIESMAKFVILSEGDVFDLTLAIRECIEKVVVGLSCSNFVEGLHR